MWKKAAFTRITPPSMWRLETPGNDPLSGVARSHDRLRRRGLPVADLVDEPVVPGGQRARLPRAATAMTTWAEVVPVGVEPSGDAHLRAPAGTCHPSPTRT